MTRAPARLDISPELRAAVDRAAADEGLSPQEWLRALVTDHLRQGGYLANADEGLRPDQLNANNDG